MNDNELRAIEHRVKTAVESGRSQECIQAIRDRAALLAVVQRQAADLKSAEDFAYEWDEMFGLE